MEANKIKGPAKSIILPNGAEITYAERGEQNEEVVISGAFYHHTFMPVIEGLAQRYHVYALVMRFDGITDQKNPDGTTHWGKQWGKDVYDFAKAMGIERFHYVGKCHGTIPGWYIFKNHPEMLIDFCSFYLGPHTMPANSQVWAGLLQGSDTTEMMRVALRKPEEGLPKKMEEVASIGPNAGGFEVMTYGGAPELLWDNNVEAIEHDLRNATVPVGYLFGSIDPLFNDYYDSNMRLWDLTRGSHFTILQGECHLMELDCPERVVDEAFAFIDQAHKNYG